MSHTPTSPVSVSLSSAASPVATPAAALAAAPTWTDAERERAFAQWLGRTAPAHGLQTASLRVAAADAGFRRYFRVDTAGHGSRIIMDAPPGKEDCKPFVRIGQLFAKAGLLTPEVLAWDEPHGFMLLSDLGADTMMAQINQNDANANLPRYQQATDALLLLQTASKPGVLPAYDAALLTRELALFPDWYVAQHKGFALNDTQRQTMHSAFELIVQRNLAAPSVYVHRDFMPRNLMVSDPDPKVSGSDPRVSGPHRLGVLDFQDAVYGPISYDIASLMRDAFLTWDEDFVLDVTIRYWEKARKLGLMDYGGWADDFGGFYRAVEWMGLQRHLKVAGIFARLTLRDGKAKYLADTPRFIHYIRTTCNRYRELGPLLKVIDEIEGTENAVAWSFGRM
jgi:N-acetylmuramate 1-kinase